MSTRRYIVVNRRVDVACKTCDHHGCSRQPTDGVDGTNNREFYSEHQSDDRVSLKSKRRGYRGCRRRPSIGVDGSKNEEIRSERNGTEWWMSSPRGAVNRDPLHFVIIRIKIAQSNFIEAVAI